MLRLEPTPGFPGDKRESDGVDRQILQQNHRGKISGGVRLAELFAFHQNSRAKPDIRERSPHRLCVGTLSSSEWRVSRNACSAFAGLVGELAARHHYRRDAEVSPDRERSIPALFGGLEPKRRHVRVTSHRIVSEGKPSSAWEELGPHPGLSRPADQGWRTVLEQWL